MRDPERPENRLPGRPRPVGSTLTDVRAPISPTEATRVTGPLLTADESDDDEPLFSDDQGAPLRIAGGDDDDDGFLESSTVVENQAMPRADAPTRVVPTPQASEVHPGERTVIAPVDFAALNGASAPTAQAAADVDDPSSDFDVPTMVGGEPPDVVHAPAPATDATFVGAVDVPTTSTADATVNQPRPIVPEMTTSTTAPSPSSLSPLAYMGIGFATAFALGLLIAAIWAMLP